MGTIALYACAIPSGASQVTCEACRRLLEIADGSLTEMDAPNDAT